MSGAASSLAPRRATVAKLVDHTLLDPRATDAQILELTAEALALDVAAVCVSPPKVALASRELRGSPVLVASVIGFPSGAHAAETKAFEAIRAVEDGAGELDMVINLSLAREGCWTAVSAEIAAVRAAVAGRSPTLKVIIESATLEPEEVKAACHAAEDGGADYVKSSTGFHPAGGASLEAVWLMARTVGGRLGVKASGGIRDAPAALAMLDVGATRLGMSASRRVLEEIPA